MAEHYIEGNNFDEIYRKLLEDLLEKPQFECAPRGAKIAENLAVTLVLHDPRSRVLRSKERKANYAFASGEFLWYWRGQRDLATMTAYMKRMEDFSDDGVTLNSAYGFRLRRHLVFNDPFGMGGNGENQWETTLQTLVSDPDSRRAVMIINLPEDQRRAATIGSKDVPCTLSLQFFVRNDRLDMHVHMRSNDVMWGLTYDLFSFTLLQECMMLELRRRAPDKFRNLELGKYYHTAGSMHLYERHFNDAQKIVAELHDFKIKNTHFTMSPVYDIDDVWEISSGEVALRERGFEIDPLQQHGDWGGLEFMRTELNEFWRKKRSRP